MRSYDAGTRSGTVFADDGTVAAFDATAVDAGGLRLLRPGQRVRLRIDGSGGVTAITLVTLPLPT